jgi:uncharacterized protein YbaA (DUF1428 family)
MTYVEGFVLAVPADKKDEYLKSAADSAPMFREFGVRRHVEAWGDDVPDGKVTDFRGAVKAEDGEIVVFSWFEYPDRATRDAANEKIMSDPRMKEMACPFDPSRMIVAGFDSIVDTGNAAGMGYADGFILPVPEGNKDAYRTMADKASKIFQEYGAVRVVEAWDDDVPDGKVTDYKMAVKAEVGEKVVFSWVEWPDKAARDAGWARVMQDERMKPDGGEMPFDGKRMFWGGFAPILDTAA